MANMKLIAVLLLGLAVTAQAGRKKVHKKDGKLPKFESVVDAVLSLNLTSLADAVTVSRLPGCCPPAVDTCCAAARINANGLQQRGCNRWIHGNPGRSHYWRPTAVPPHPGVPRKCAC